MTEEELIERIRSRNTVAAGILYDRYAALLYGVVFHLVESEKTAQEILEETFVKIWSSFPAYNVVTGKFSDWLVKVAGEMVLNKIPSVEIPIEIKNITDEKLSELRRNPAPELRTAVMERIQSIENVNSFPKGKENPSEKSHLLRYSIYGCIALMFISLVFNYALFSKLKTVKSERDELLSKNGEITSELKDTKSKYIKIWNDFKVVTNPDYLNIKLKGMKTSLEATAEVFWNPVTGNSYLDVKNLPPPASGKQYQLWAMQKAKNGSMPLVNAGMIEIGSEEGIYPMKNISKADIWGITLEKKGGSDLPNLSELYMKSED